MELEKSGLGFEPRRAGGRGMACTSALFYSREPGKF